jgi:hypothetical protein
LFQGLIRIDATNPAPEMKKATAYLETHFDCNCIDCDVLGERDRENAIAKIGGQGGGTRPVFGSEKSLFCPAN